MNKEKFKLKIFDRKTLLKEVELILNEIIIGSDEDCNIRLNHPTIYPKHVKITIDKGVIYIEPISIGAFLFILDKKIENKTLFTRGSRVKIGNFSFEISGEISSEIIKDDTEPKKESQEKSVNKQEVSPHPNNDRERKDEESFIKRNNLRREIYKEIETLLAIENNIEFSQSEKERIKKCIGQIFIKKNMVDSNNELTEQLMEEFTGLGPIKKLLMDNTISEIMINGKSNIYIEKNGKLIRTKDTLSSNNSLKRIINRLLFSTGKIISEKNPIIDARLKDGSRLNVIIHPLSVKGPNVTIRKFKDIPFSTESLIKMNTISVELAEFLEISVKNRINILISGGTSTGKTTFLNYLSSFIPDNERIITIEDAAELKLMQSHVVTLEAKPPDATLLNGIPIRTLVINALRMRPDRIIVGECRGAEALDMLQAMNTGHDGSMTTLHANSPRDVFSRIETMVLMSGIELNVRAIRNHIANAIQLIIHMGRMSDGTRKITKVTEISGMEGEIISTSDIFIFKQEGVDDDGHIIGKIAPTGIVPSFYDKLRSKGLKVNSNMFKS